MAASNVSVSVRVYEVAPFPARQEEAPVRSHTLEENSPFAIEFERYLLQSFDKVRRLYFSVKWFGVGALLTAARV